MLRKKALDESLKILTGRFPDLVLSLVGVSAPPGTVQEMLEDRFGPLPPETTSRLETVGPEWWHG
ncbi:MAG: hypothetical protein FJX77_18255 [Armatimonadetes bacterium]|nr:hypothetical protein [Armatimonadota bacterium]